MSIRSNGSEGPAGTPAADEPTAEPIAGADEPLSDGRRNRIWARLELGFYDDPTIAEFVAQRILESGDLDALG